MRPFDGHPLYLSEEDLSVAVLRLIADPLGWDETEGLSQLYRRCLLS